MNNNNSAKTQRTDIFVLVGARHVEEEMFLFVFFHWRQHGCQSPNDF